MSKNKPTYLEQIFVLKRELKEKDEIIKKLYRKLHNYEKIEKKESKKQYKEKEEPEIKEGSCPDCIKGKLKTSELGVRSLITCTNCSYRKVIKK